MADILPWPFYILGHNNFGGDIMSDPKQNPQQRTKFDGTGIGLVPIGFPGEYGFFLEEDIPHNMDKSSFSI